MNLFHDVWGLNWGDSKAGEDAIAGVWDDWKTQLCVWCLDWEEDQDCWSYLWPLPVAWASSQHGCLREVFLHSSWGLQVQVFQWTKQKLNCLFTSVTLDWLQESHDPTQQGKGDTGPTFWGEKCQGHIAEKLVGWEILPHPFFCKTQFATLGLLLLSYFFAFYLNFFKESSGIICLCKMFLCLFEK